VVFSFSSVLGLLLGNDNKQVVFFGSVLGLLRGNDNKQVVFFLSVLGLLLGNDNKPLPRERINALCSVVHWSNAGYFC
jgi:hypothetical protein